ASQTGGSTDPAFLTVSPDGQRIAIGAGFGKPVAVFETNALGTPNAPTTLTSGTLADYFTVGHFDGTWFDNTSLALTAGEFGQPSFVSMLDTTSAPDNPLNEPVVTNILGGSAGVVFDSAGRLYTANGFAYGTGSDTGNIRVFEAADWLGGVDFETGGTLIGDVLSGNALNIDADGNLFVGGGDFNNFDAGYLGIINAQAIADALAGSGPIDPDNPLHLARLDPRLDGFGFFGSAFNPATGELYITDGQTWYATVPAPSSLALLAAAGLVSRRRRRG
ncbi:MAG: PEP-CTERM sorting domain-containing protein, partial [Phycisphaerales bacterium JB041]